MTTTQNTATEILSNSTHDAYHPVRQVGDHIFIEAPGAALNAADYLRRRGIWATAVRFGGQWCVEVYA